MKYEIAVIIPVFNRTFELERALNSLLIQNFDKFEVIVCDDGSTCNIKNIVNIFENKLNIKYIRIENSGGPAKPRNIAVNNASSTWLSFLDSDDWWDPNRLSEVYKYLTCNDNYIYHKLRIRRQESKNLSMKPKLVGCPFECDPLRHLALLGNPIPLSSALIRRDSYLMLGGMNENLLIAGLEDFDFWIRVSASGIKPTFINKVLGSYWVGADSISNLIERQTLGFKLIYKKNFLSMYGDKSLSRLYYLLGSINYKIYSKNKSALIYLLRAKHLIKNKHKVIRLLRILVLFSRIYFFKLYKKLN